MATTLRRRAPYKTGDPIHGLTFPGCGLGEGTVISCTWDDEDDYWTVLADMGDPAPKRYPWVDDNGESDYCGPGRVHQCIHNARVEHRDGCPHSATARTDLLDAVRLGEDLGYTVRVPGHYGDTVTVTLTGYGTQFALNYRYDRITEKLTFRSGAEREGETSTPCRSWRNATNRIRRAAYI